MLNSLDLRQHPIESSHKLVQAKGLQQQAETECWSSLQSFFGYRDSDRREPVGKFLPFTLFGERRNSHVLKLKLDAPVGPDLEEEVLAEPIIV